MKMRKADHSETSLLINLQEQLSDIKLRIALVEAARLEDESNKAKYNALPADSPERLAEEQFHQRMEPKILLMMHKIQRKQKKKDLIQYTRKVMRFAAAVILVACIGLGTAMAVSSEVRVTVMKLLYNVTPQYTEIQLVPDEEASFTVPADWTGDFYPAIIPEGYSLYSIQGTKSVKNASFVGENDKLMEFYENDPGVETNIDTEGYAVREVEFNGHLAVLATKDNISKIVWQEGNKSLHLSLTEDAETALLIARGIKRVK